MPRPLTPTVDPPAVLLERIARLERRLERESRARHEAELIAERETLNLFRQKEQMRLLSELAIMANRSGDLTDVLRIALESICRFNGWTGGHVQFVDTPAEGRRRLRASGISWVRASFDASLIIAATQDLEFDEGVGLPGLVLSDARAHWHANETDPSFPRARIALDHGIAGAIALPVMVGSEVAAVLEFAQEIALDPGQDTLDFLDRIGAVLGRAIERDRATVAAAAAQRDLEQMLHRAEAASRAKTQLLAVASHEVRTPLNAVLGLAEALAATPLDGEQRDHLDGIRRSGGMLLRLLSAVMDFVRVESGASAVAQTEFDLVQMTRDLFDLWRTPAGAKGLSMTLDLTALPESCRILSDPGKIEQTLTNLISNAVKFTPVGGAIHVRLSPSAGKADRMLVEVRDTGQGIADDDRDQLFTPFQPARQGRETGGVGMGLAICAANIQALGGEIGCDSEAESRAAGGFRFWFDFPAEPAKVASEPEPTETMPALALRILAAEDNPANRRVLQLLLSQVGLEALIVDDGQAALEAVQQEPFDLILMDANMPRMDGVTATRAIRALETKACLTPIVMVTANVFEDDLVRYHEAGVDGVLAKPIIVSELFGILAAVQEMAAAR
ncbi:ATP-binding protein [Caulobacter sp. ErkDOM-YI]|uniref:ATP-binding protein n=1 Tax=unclassified Caulobacter TaxID=2648921 RepID=UPI003AF77F63